MYSLNLSEVALSGVTNTNFAPSGSSSSAPSYAAHVSPVGRVLRFKSNLNAIVGTTTIVVPACGCMAGKVNSDDLPIPVAMIATRRGVRLNMARRASSWPGRNSALWLLVKIRNSCRMSACAILSQRAFSRSLIRRCSVMRLLSSRSGFLGLRTDGNWRYMCQSTLTALYLTRSSGVNLRPSWISRPYTLASVLSLWPDALAWKLASGWPSKYKTSSVLAATEFLAI
ncbi:hypothetical protein LAUMK15_05735 [Mycobacterium persicum]|nr:hypothetical protein LAUMK15_05735 [Mycobacterium persicum]